VTPANDRRSTRADVRAEAAQRRCLDLSGPIPSAGTPEGAAYRQGVREALVRLVRTPGVLAFACGAARADNPETVDAAFVRGETARIESGCPAALSPDWLRDALTLEQYRAHADTRGAK
jgi:hypothetical protein